jgi:hypothetical protein
VGLRERLHSGRLPIGNHVYEKCRINDFMVKRIIGGTEHE